MNRARVAELLRELLELVEADDAPPTPKRTPRPRTPAREPTPLERERARKALLDSPRPSKARPSGRAT